jgi:resuscitation-promoting factor RpfB
MATTTAAQVTQNRSAAWQLGVSTRALSLLGGLVVMWIVWTATAHPVTVAVDGVAQRVQTHRATVGNLLVDLGLDLHAADRVTPAPSTRLRDVSRVTIERARPVQIVVDGRTIRSASWGESAALVLADVGVAVDSYDTVIVDGLARSLDAHLPEPGVVQNGSRFAPVAPWANLLVMPLQITVVRAIPIIVDDGTLPFSIRTTAQTVGEALRQAEITLYLGDRVSPSLGSEVVTGLRVSIQRSIPVVIAVDGRTIKTRTRGETVADALAELRVGVAGRDRVTPPLESALYDGIKIGVTRVETEVMVSEEIAPFETVFVADPSLPIDTQQVQAAGAEGITRTRYRIHYEDGGEVARVAEDNWIAQEPADRVVAYGQRIEPQTFTAPDGTQITYWRKIRMQAFSYSAGTAGVSRSNPNFGRTYTGDTMRFGIVAVDPSIIPLRSQVYVPGYGVGDALDTGSAIRSRRIDLGYDDSNLVLWNRWVDVYLLWPPPPAARITWVVPNWPRVPQ